MKSECSKEICEASRDASVLGDQRSIRYRTILCAMQHFLFQNDETERDRKLVSERLRAKNVSLDLPIVVQCVINYRTYLIDLADRLANEASNPLWGNAIDQRDQIAIEICSIEYVASA